MIKRVIFDKLMQQVDYKKAIILLGPRQVGKTTLVKEMASALNSNFLYINGDLPVVQEQLNNPSLSFLQSYFGDRKVIMIDEAQRIKNIGITLKLILDSEQDVQFLVSGSSALELANTVNEPLTGRKWEHMLYPISWQELCNYETMSGALSRLQNLIIYGMYPEILTHTGQEKDILNNLSSSYLYKDLLSFQGIRKPELLNKILLALAFQMGSPVNLNGISRTV